MLLCCVAICWAASAFRAFSSASLFSNSFLLVSSSSFFKQKEMHLHDIKEF